MVYDQALPGITYSWNKDSTSAFDTILSSSLLTKIITQDKKWGYI